jgi:hypothetical protein
MVSILSCLFIPTSGMDLLVGSIAQAWFYYPGYKVLLIQICNLPAMGDAGSYTRPWVDTDSVSNSKGREKGGKACRYGQYLLDYIANERA